MRNSTGFYFFNLKFLSVKKFDCTFSLNYYFIEIIYNYLSGFTFAQCAVKCKKLFYFFLILKLQFAENLSSKIAQEKIKSLN